jgi:hypothetical protein
LYPRFIELTMQLQKYSTNLNFPRLLSTDLIDISLL